MRFLDYEIKKSKKICLFSFDDTNYSDFSICSIKMLLLLCRSEDTC